MVRYVQTAGKSDFLLKSDLKDRVSTLCHYHTILSVWVAVVTTLAVSNYVR